MKDRDVADLVRHGVALMQQGQHTLALEPFRQALAIEPGALQILGHMGNCLQVLGDSDQALQCYRQQLRYAPESAAVWANLGIFFQNEGRFKDAAIHLSQAVTLDPNLVQAQQSLAWALAQLGKYEEAAAVYSRVVQMLPDDYNAHLNLGAAFQTLGRLEDAMASYRRSGELDPSADEPIAAEATLLEKLGLRQQGWELIDRAWTRGHQSARMAVARLALCPDDPCRREMSAHLEQALSQRELPRHQQASIHIQLARYYEKAGAFDRAFRNFAAANATGSGAYDPAEISTYVDRLIGAFPSIDPYTDNRTGSRPRPVFIVGMPRSGTTLAEQILGCHPSVATGGELTAIASLTEALPAPRYPECMRGLPGDIPLFTSLADSYLQALRHVSSDAALVTDKMPHNFLHLGFIHRLFPDALIVHCRRDALDTCLSCYFQTFFTAHPYSTDLTNLGAYYRQYDRLMHHWRESAGVPLFELRYEDLVADQRSVTRSLLEYCGLEWEEGCLQFHRNARQATTLSYDQVRRPIYSASVGRWRSYAKHIDPLIEALGNLARTDHP